MDNLSKEIKCSRTHCTLITNVLSNGWISTSYPTKVFSSMSQASSQFENALKIKLAEHIRPDRQLESIRRIRPQIFHINRAIVAPGRPSWMDCPTAIAAMLLQGVSLSLTLAVSK